MRERTINEIKRLKERIEVCEAYLRGEKIEFRGYGVWVETSFPKWSASAEYRIKGKIKPIVHWDMLDDKYKFVCFAPNHLPFASVHKPYIDTLKGCWWLAYKDVLFLHDTKIVSNPDCIPWYDSLVERP